MPHTRTHLLKPVSDYIVPQLSVFNNCLWPAYAILNLESHPNSPAYLIPPTPPAFFPTFLVTCKAAGMQDLSLSCFWVYHPLCLKSPSCLVHSHGASHLSTESQLTNAEFPCPWQADHTHYTPVSLPVASCQSL